MHLRQIRKSRNLTQKELAEMSGVNFRSLQDYEQGHKKLTSANGDILLRLSTVLGCTTEELLLPEDFCGASILSSNELPTDIIQGQRFYCEKYKIAGRWLCHNSKIATMFYFEGKQYILPFPAVFRVSLLESLKDAASLQIESKIDHLLLEKNGFESW